MTMFTQKYSFQFPPITSKPAQVWFINNSSHQEFFGSISINDYQFLTQGDVLIPSLLADLIDISIAIHFVDRSIKKNKEVSYCFDLNIYVRNPEFFRSGDITDLIKDVLFWFTEDHWTFTFSSRQSLFVRQSEIQPHLTNFNKGSCETEVALWSGGLDSLAGLYNRLKQNPSAKYVLVGTGSNNQNFHTQEKVAELVRNKFSSPIDLIQIPYQMELPNIGSKSRNRYQRSRGFTFMVIGSVAAYLKGQRGLFIYENGIGAINLPYTESEIGLDHTRSVNPISLSKMSQLVTRVIGEPFQIYNPYLFWTKAEMCRTLVDSKEMELISSTKSCDSQQRNKVSGVMQCGVCSSCILRRLALEFWGSTDPTEYLPSEFKTSSERKFLKAMIYQTKNLQTAIRSDNVWLSLSSKYIALEQVIDCLLSDDNNGNTRSYYEDQIIRLYTTYCKEWAQVQRQGASFLK